MSLTLLVDYGSTCSRKASSVSVWAQFVGAHGRSVKGEHLHGSRAGSEFEEDTVERK